MKRSMSHDMPSDEAMSKRETWRNRRTGRLVSVSHRDEKSVWYRYSEPRKRGAKLAGTNSVDPSWFALRFERVNARSNP